MKIKEVSEMFNISSDTLRYYEKAGLLEPVKRVNGVRDYSEDDLFRIRFVKCMRQAGLSIEAILRYVDLYNQGDSTLEDRLNILLKERDKIDLLIENLQETKKYLNTKIENYQTKYSLLKQTEE